MLEVSTYANLIRTRDFNSSGRKSHRLVLCCGRDVIASTIERGVCLAGAGGGGGGEMEYHL